MRETRIALRERVTWRTGIGNNYTGEVLAFVPAGQAVDDVLRLAGVGGLGRMAAKSQIRLKVSAHDRYVVARSAGRFVCQNATLIERQNPDAKRVEEHKP